MDHSRRLYLHLTLIQGFCLALGFALYTQWQTWTVPPRDTLTIESTESDSFSPPSVPLFHISHSMQGGSIIFLGTWGLLTGMTGWMMMKDQRTQLLAVLRQHDAPSHAALRLFQTDDPDASPDRQNGIPMTPGEERLSRQRRLQLANDEENFWQEDEEMDGFPQPHPAIRLHAMCQPYQE